MTTDTGPIRKNVEDEDLRWDRGSESGPTMGPLRGVLKLSNRDNVQGVSKKLPKEFSGLCCTPHYKPLIVDQLLNDPVTYFFPIGFLLRLCIFKRSQVMSMAKFIPTAPNFGLSWMDPATFFETPCDDDGLNSDLHAIPLMWPIISFLFVGEVLYMRNAANMKSLFYRIILLRIGSSTILQIYKWIHPSVCIGSTIL